MRGSFAKKGTQEYWERLYDAYKNQRARAQSKNYLLSEQLSFYGFQDAYTILAEEKGVQANRVRTLVNEETLISYTDAKIILKKKDPTAKLTRENILREINPEDLQKYIDAPFMEWGKRYNTRKGMSITQAYFAYMAEIGMRDEAEEDYGY